MSLAALFAGRTDDFGTVEGGRAGRPLTEADWRAHTEGEGSVGVYPLVKDGDRTICKWFGTDIDVQDIEKAKVVVLALEALKISPAWIERSKGKGYHVLVFLDEWIEAKWARRAMLLAHHLAEVPPTEVYPKQEELNEKLPWGNYLNVPYARKWADEGKRVVLDTTTEPPGLLSLDEFLERATVTAVGTAPVEAAGRLWKPPAASAVDLELDEVPNLAKLSKLGKHMLKEGPINDGKVDRSAYLLRLAREAKASGFTAAQTVALLWEADDIHTRKFVVRSDGRRRIEDTVTAVWERN